VGFAAQGDVPVLLGIAVKTELLGGGPVEADVDRRAGRQTAQGLRNRTVLEVPVRGGEVAARGARRRHHARPAVRCAPQVERAVLAGETVNKVPVAGRNDEIVGIPAAIRGCPRRGRRLEVELQVGYRVDRFKPSIRHQVRLGATRGGQRQGKNENDDRCHPLTNDTDSLRVARKPAKLPIFPILLSRRVGKRCGQVPFQFPVITPGKTPTWHAGRSV
jgi:hypothetical protein